MLLGRLWKCRRARISDNKIPMELNQSKLLAQYTRNSPSRWKTYGFIKVPTALIFEKRISRVGILLYVVLAAHTFKGKASCFPSLTTIAEEAHCSKSTAIKATKELERLNLITVDRKRIAGNKNKANRYFIKKFIEIRGP